MAASITLLTGDGELHSQSYVRGFGEHVFDTSLHDASDFAAVVAGLRHSLALRSNGDVVGWGGFPFVTNVPDLPLPAIKVATAKSSSRAAAVLADGSIVTWGWDFSSPVPPLPAGIAYTGLAIAATAGAAIRSDGQIVAWGDPAAGLTSPPPLPAGLTYIDVSGGYEFFVALRSDGALVGWGWNNLGQTNVPTAPVGVSYVSISCGEASSHALRSDGQIDAWGYSNDGQLNVPPLPTGLTYVQSSAGRGFGLAVRSDGAVVGWGLNTWGQLNVPALPTGIDVAKISAGQSHAAMVRSDGRIVSWGGQGFFEQNFTAANNGAVPIAIDSEEDGVQVLDDTGALSSQGFLYTGLPAPPAGVTYTSISAEFGDAAAVRSDGIVATSGAWQLPPLPGGVTYVDADVAYNGILCLRSDGLTEVAGTSTFSNLPPPPSGTVYVDIEASSFQTGLLSNGDVVVVSSPWQGYAPPPLPSGLEYLAIATGASYGLCLRSDGEIISWGNAFSGSSTPAASAPALPTGLTYVGIAAEDFHSVARRSDGTIVAWHCDPAYAGATANGSLVPANTGLSNSTYNAISAGVRSTVAIMGPTSTFVTFAQGCAGSLPSARLVPEDTPRIGRDLIVRVFDLPLGLAVLAAGLSNTVAPFGPLPASAAPLGMPGCTIHISPDTTAVVGSFGATGPADFTLPIPNDNLLLGATIYWQAVVLDSGANPAGLLLSDAAKSVVGR